MGGSFHVPRRLPAGPANTEWRREAAHRIGHRPRHRNHAGAVLCRGRHVDQSAHAARSLAQDHGHRPGGHGHQGCRPLCPGPGVRTGPAGRAALFHPARPGGRILFCALRRHQGGRAGRHDLFEIAVLGVSISMALTPILAKLGSRWTRAAPAAAPPSSLPA